MSSELEFSSLLDNLEDAIKKDQIYVARELLGKADEAVDKSDLVKTYFEKNADKLKELRDNIATVDKLLASMKSEEGWIKAKEKQGITVLYHKKEDSPMIMTKIETFFPAEPEELGHLFIKLIALFNETDLMPKWYPRGVMKSCDMDQQVTKFSKTVTSRIKAPLVVSLILGPREAKLYGKGFDMSERSQVVITVTTLKDGEVVNGVATKPASKGYTQYFLEAAFFFELTEKGIDFRVVQSVDLNSHIIPPFIMNLLAKGLLPFEMIHNIRQKLKKFKGSLWEKRIEENPHIYDEVEKRLEEFMEKNFGSAKAEA